MKPIRVCCFCEVWENGGIESFLKNVLCRMNGQAIEVDLVACCIRPSVFTEELESIGVRFLELSGDKSNFLSNLKGFWRLLQERRYDVIHFNLFQGLSLSYVHLAKRAGVPVRIAHSHNTDLRKSPFRWLKVLLHRVGRGLFSSAATHLWACSGAAAEFLFFSNVLKEKTVQVIPNGIETERFRFDCCVRDKLRDSLGVAGKLVIGNVGRLCQQKNQDFLLDVLAEVLTREPDSVLLLVGAGEQEQALREKAARLGVETSVVFYGATDRVEPLLWVMDVFAFPSRFEGLGIVAVEAQAAGLQVLCSEHVPQEVFVTHRAKVCALEAGAAAWARQLIACRTVRERESGADEVRMAGFDAADVAQEVARGYGC